MKTRDDLGHRQATAEHRVFGAIAPTLQNMTFQVASANSTDYHGGSWAFVSNDDDSVGFWYPTDQPNYPVACENYYSDEAMPAKAFGAACTLVALNQFLWHMHSAGHNADALSDQFHALRNWVFDLADEGQIDGAAVAGFID